MVKRTALGLLLIVPLLLGACELFTALFALSPFPAYLSQAVSSVDLREPVEKFLGDDYSRWEADVHVLRNSSSEYVFLIVRKEPGGQRVFAFDTELRLRAADSVTRWSNLHLVDANDDFIAGHVRFDGTTLDTALGFPLTGREWDPGFSEGTDNFILWSDGFNLWCERFNQSWGSSGTNQTALGTLVPVWLEGLGYDDSLGVVFLFFRGSDAASDDEFFRIAATPAASYPTLVSNVFLSYPTSGRVYGVRPDRRIAYTRKGVVVRIRDQGGCYLLAPDGRIRKRFDLSNDDRTAYGFDLDGEYYYVFDVENYRLYKAATGF